MSNKLTRYREYRVKWRYEILLVSFMVLLFGDIFFGPNIDPTALLMIQNVLASAFIFYTKKNWRMPIAAFLIFLVSLEVLNYFITVPKVRIVFFASYVIYFIILSVEVYRQIIRNKEVDIGMVSAVLCGFTILGLIGGFVFTIVEVIQPNSFSNLAQGFGAVSDLIYFSFVTILTIGYGEITPTTDIAQKLAVFFGLIGYFYGVVVIGIIMGKYISRKG